MTALESNDIIPTLDNAASTLEMHWVMKHEVARPDEAVALSLTQLLDAAGAKLPDGMQITVELEPVVGGRQLITIAAREVVDVE